MCSPIQEQELELEKQRNQVLREQLSHSFQVNLLQRLESSALAEVSCFCITQLAEWSSDTSMQRQALNSFT